MTQPIPKKRRLKQGSYKSFKLSKPIKHHANSLPSAWRIFKDSFDTLRKNWRFFGGISAVYAGLLFVFVRGVGGGIDIVGTKEAFQESITDTSSNWSASFALFGDLTSGAGSASGDTASLYQSIILIVCSLAVIWGLRQVYSKNQKKLRVKEAFYSGMYPLVPVILVLGVILLQLLPLTIAGSLYSSVIGSGLATTSVEQLIWTVLVILLMMLSLYMIASSIFAIYIATLPNMTPLQALRSARGLVQHRRFLILRRLILLPLVSFIVLGFVVIPLIAFIPVIAELTFFVLSAALLPIAHAYVYNLYRALL